MGAVLFLTGILAQPNGKDILVHAYPSSLVNLADGRLLCTFYGRGPGGAADSGCFAAFSTDDGQTWSKPELLLGRDGKHVHADPNVVIADKRLMIFSTSYPYSDGKADLRRSTTWKIVSDDGARTWSKPVEFPQPHNYCAGMVHAGFKMPDGTLLMGYSWDKVAERGGDPLTEGGQDYCAGVLRSTDVGRTWKPGADIRVGAQKKATQRGIGGADEPAVALLDDGSLYALVRTGGDHLWETRSRDGGVTWDPPRESPLVSHNCPAELLRLRGKPETVMVVFDHNPRERRPLCAAHSTDGCRTWSEPKIISDPPAGWQAGYPVACQTPKGTIVVAWYQGNPANKSGAEAFHIRYARFNRAWLLSEKG